MATATRRYSPPIRRREFLELAGGLALGAGAVGTLTGFRLDTLGGPYKELAREIGGTVVLPSSGAAYQQGKVSYNARFDGAHPKAIVYCASAEDVQKTVRWAHKHSIRIVPRSGGHSYGGYSSTSAGVVIDVSRMKGVHVSGDTADVGAGAHLIDVYAGLDPHGVTVPAGSCPTVGVAGLALGGGAGFAGRKLGLTTDNIVGVSIVTADGKLRECSAREHSDLLWACRGGGGGNFGIVTGFRFRTHAVGDVSYYQVIWPWSDAAAALGAWQGFAPHAPDELFSTFFMGTTGPKGPGTVPAVSSGGQYFGTQADLQNLIAPLTSTGSPIHVTVGTLSYMDAMFRWAGCQALPQCEVRGQLTFKAKSDYVNTPLSGAGIATLQSALEASQANASLGRAELICDAYGGAINRVHPSATSFVHRNSLFSIQYVSSWNGSGTADRKWIADLYAAMRPHASGFAYQNYIDPDLHSWRHAYYGANFERLVAVKKKYDPHDTFRFAQSIPTRL